MQVQFIKIDLEHEGCFTLINPGSIVCISVAKESEKLFRFTVTLVGDISHRFEAETLIGGLSKLGISMSGLNLAR